MSKFSTIALALVFAAGVAGIAFADDKPSDDEVAKIKAAVEQFGCSGGTYEKNRRELACLRPRTSSARPASTISASPKTSRCSRLLLTKLWPGTSCRLHLA